MKKPSEEKDDSSLKEKIEEKKEEDISDPPITKTKKYKTVKCNDEMSFEECELTLLRSVVDLGTEQEGKNLVQNPDIQRMIQLLEEWLREKGNMCYGGTALNAVLPKNVQFYNRDVEIPDYDFFSPHALQDAIELSQYYRRAGFEMIEAKSGVHHGTYKVYVNFIPLADITQLEPVLYKNMKEDSIAIGGISYAPIHFLRLACFTELSRPKGDVSRWEKVFKRLTLLNQYYPLKSSIPCELVEFQRPMTPSAVSKASKKRKSAEEKEEEFETTQKNIYEWTRDVLIEQGAVFFGGYATSMYAKHMSAKERAWVKQIPDFDVLCVNAEECAQKVAEDLKAKGVVGVFIQENEAIGEIVPRHYQIMVFGKETICFVFEPIACHSYNQITSGGKKINIATVDTMLSLYLAFIYTGKPYFYKERILCMAQYLFEVEQANRLEQKGVLKRFTMDCVGKQESLIDIREEKARKFRELKKGTVEYNEWFLKYNPATDKEPLLKKEEEKKEEKRAIEFNGRKSKKYHKKPAYKKQYKTRRHRKSTRSVYFY
jgi:hypothetical protein